MYEKKYDRVTAQRFEFKRDVRNEISRCVKTNYRGDRLCACVCQHENVQNATAWHIVYFR